MQRFSDIVQDISLRDPASRETAKEELRRLQRQVNSVECPDEYPLKHETLEYAIIHTLDALEAFEAGDGIEANRALDRALLNVERFQRWPVDVD